MSQAKTFGRYTLIRKVAQGGMAEIFLAKFQGIGGFEKKIIIKRILPRFSENQEFIKMLIHEAKTAVQLHHQNIVQIYDLGKVRDTYFISMEYIKGKDLRTVLNRLKSQGQLMPRELAVFITREMCKGLDYAHNITDQHGEPLNLVHRDISPPNVLLSLEGEVKIIDFGIAKATSQATDTQAGVFKGKFAYMAPEQASGIAVDRRADIFAAGLILWEMLTCKKLLEAESDILTLERAKKIDTYNIPFGDYNIPEQLEHIIRKALKQDRNSRYQAAGEMARDLTIYLNLNYPGFSETDLADNLRQLFNLDKRRGGAGGDMVTHGQGERSLTGSDFFRALAQTGQDHTDPSVKGMQDNSAPRLTSGAAAGAVMGGAAGVATAAPTSKPAVTRKRPEGRASADSGEFWSLEAEIRDEIEVFALNGQNAAEGAAAQEGAGRPGQTGWVSQLAEDFVRAEDGTLHPLISDALRGTQDASPRAEQLGADDPTILVQDGQVVRLDRGVHQTNGVRLAHENPYPVGFTGGSTTGSPTGSGTGSTTGNDRYGQSTSGQGGRGVGLWAVGGVAALLMMMVTFTLAFPAQTQQIKEKLGLLKKTQVALTYQPPDAQVLLNGAVQSQLASPASLSLPVGQRYKLTLHKEGFIDHDESLDLTTASGPVSLNINLEPAIPRGTGKLVLKGLMPNSVVYINGGAVSMEKLSELPTGVPLKVKIAKDHYIPSETSLTLGDEPTTLAAGLEPEPVRLSVDVGGIPKATVTVDGKEVGNCPYVGEGYLPGRSYRVEIAAPGYRSYTTVVTPSVGSSVDLRIPLVPVASNERPRAEPVRVEPPKQHGTTPASTPEPVAAANTPAVAEPPAPEPPPRNANGMVQVSILVKPWAEVYIDNKYVGRTPQRLFMKVGRHTLRLVNTELQIDYEVEKEIAPPQYAMVQTFTFELGP